MLLFKFRSGRCKEEDRLLVPEAPEPVTGRLEFIVDERALEGLENREKFKEGDAVTAEITGKEMSACALLKFSIRSVINHDSKTQKSSNFRFLNE